MKPILLFPVVVLTCIACKENVETVCCNSIPIPSDTYVYPMRPGTPAWIDSVQSTEEGFRVCQIPENVVETMSTEGLIQSLIDNPCLPLMDIYSDHFQGRDFVLSHLNIFQELNKRDDAASKLARRYEQMTPCCIENKVTPLERGTLTVGWYHYELIIMQDSIINQLNKYEKILLTEAAITHYREKERYQYGVSQASGALLLSQIMKLNAYPPYMEELSKNEELTVFSETMGAAHPKTIQNLIMSYAEEFLENLKS